ncbi:MAG: FAD-binding oxidoreductase [Hyphomicrobiales bacterium]|nr:MAG: FAD-binding oxidoreductase [Hyphomicrobiales bacterium]
MALSVAAGATLSAAGWPAVALSTPFHRTRPGMTGWPSDTAWEALNTAVGGQLRRLAEPFAACAVPDGSACRAADALLRNSFAIGDDPALTQASGWLDAWNAAPSAYVVAARHAADVAAAVDFAARHRLRLVIKGGGHSYHGASSAADSLQIWTRPMRQVVLHDEFAPVGCRDAGNAVSIGAGARWLEAYQAVTTAGRRYVQGGGCTTVGVAGLIHGGGFGSFSKRFGLAAGSLLEAEIVTADGQVRIANPSIHSDLFWALKGGGGGSFGVVTRVTLRTHALPHNFGAVFGRIKASSDNAYAQLVGAFLDLYAARLFNENWGEQIRLGPDRTLTLGMVFQGLEQSEAEAIWRPFLDWLAHRSADYAWSTPARILSVPGRHLWDADWLRANAPDLIAGDDRPGAPTEHFVWAGDAGQAGQFIHGYGSRWLPQSLLDPFRRPALAEALLRAARAWPLSLHFNKGLAGAPAGEIEAARDSAVHPAAIDAFALAICGAHGPAAYPGLPTSRADPGAGRERARRVEAAMSALRELAPGSGSYVSEANYFEADWQSAFWGPNYPRLLDIKRRYDPSGLFFVHHGVGSENWTADGFEKR